MQRLSREVVRAWRELGKTPAFTLTAVLTIATGIGATTAIFTLVYDVLLKPLPYSHPEQLVVMEEQVAEFRDLYPKLPMNANHFFNWQQNSQTVQSMAIVDEGSMPFGAGGHPEEVDVVRATPGIFSVLGVEPVLGRSFTSQENKPDHERVVILMHSLWQTQFSSDPAVLGKHVTIDGFPYTVIGVMPPSFHFPVAQSLSRADRNRAHPVQALIPMTFSQAALEEAMGDFNYFGLARLKPGVSVSQASAEIITLQHSISASLSGDDKATLSAVLTPFQQILIGDNQTALLILLGAVAGLLLVGCLNITNLLLARAVGRRRQFAIAAAIGAGRAEMLRLGIREPALLAFIGGGLGILLAMVIVPFMQYYLPPELDFRGTLHLDWVGVVCALFLVFMVTLLVGAIPAGLIARTHPQQVLQTEVRMSAESPNTRRLRRSLVATEVAISVALVLMTGLLIASLIQLLRINRGFAGDHVITVQVDLPDSTYTKTSSRVSFYKDLLDRLHRLPSVNTVGLTSVLPLAGDYWVDSIRTPSDARPAMQLPAEHFRWISPDYFSALGLPLKTGRFLNAGDEGKHCAIISELTARTLWPGVDPVGQQFYRAGSTEEAPFTVIGVVGDARTISLGQPDPMMVYIPYWYRSETSAGFVLRTEQDPAEIADAVRKTVWEANPEVSVPTVRTLDFGMLVVVGALACLLPARRAAGISPMEALRSE